MVQCESAKADELTIIMLSKTNINNNISADEFNDDNDNANSCENVKLDTNEPNSESSIKCSEMTNAECSVECNASFDEEANAETNCKPDRTDTDANVEQCKAKMQELVTQQNSVRNAIHLDQQLPDVEDVEEKYGWKAQMSVDPFNLK